jgi:sugar O-acyltransferase (sialic acid O-acetyltransferase NeuD family)
VDKIQKIVIYGDSDFAEQVKYQLDTDSRYKVIAFVVDKSMYTKNIFMDLPVYEFHTLNNYYHPNDIKIFVAIGYSKMNTIRKAVIDEVKSTGYNLLTYISPSATIYKDAIIGEGTYIANFVSIEQKVTIGKGVILLPKTHIHHESIIGNYSYLASGIIVGGKVSIGNNVFIGIHSTIKNDIKIASFNLIGQCSNVIRSTNSMKVYVGNPATQIKDTDLNNMKI